MSFRTVLDRLKREKPAAYPQMERIIRPPRPREEALSSVSDQIPHGIPYALGEMLPKNFDLTVDYIPQRDMMEWTVFTQLYAKGCMSGTVLKAIKNDRAVNPVERILAMEHECMMRDLADHLFAEGWAILDQLEANR